MFPSLYAIITGDSLRDSPVAWAQILAESGVKIIQYRAKDLCSRDLFEHSRQIASLSRRIPFRFVVNDRADIAVLSGAGGVHVGQEDLEVEMARRICGGSLWVGVSTHSLEQVERAIRTSADYIAVGPIFPTTTKANADPVVGVELIRRARSLTDKPLVAIGGITRERAGEVYRAGADCVAVASDLLSAAYPAARAREYFHVAEEIFGAE